MSKITSNKFSTYELSEEERVSGHSFSEYNLQVLHNEASLAAHEIIALQYDETSPMLYVQRKAYLQGKIDFVAWLMEVHQQVNSINEVVSTPDEDFQLSSPTDIFKPQ